MEGRWGESVSPKDGIPISVCCTFQEIPGLRRQPKERRIQVRCLGWKLGCRCPLGLIYCFCAWGHPTRITLPGQATQQVPCEGQWEHGEHKVREASDVVTQAMDPGWSHGVSRQQEEGLFLGSVWRRGLQGSRDGRGTDAEMELQSEASPILCSLFPLQGPCRAAPAIFLCLFSFWHLFTLFGTEVTTLLIPNRLLSCSFFLMIASLALKAVFNQTLLLPFWLSGNIFFQT